MKLFEVTNGYTGESYVRLLVICDTPERAQDIARPIYEKEGKYWERLEATELCDDVSNEWCNERIDG